MKIILVGDTRITVHQKAFYKGFSNIFLIIAHSYDSNKWAYMNTKKLQTESHVHVNICRSQPF